MDISWWVALLVLAAIALVVALSYCVYMLLYSFLQISAWRRQAVSPQQFEGAQQRIERLAQAMRQYGVQSEDIRLKGRHFTQELEAVRRHHDALMQNLSWKQRVEKATIDRYGRIFAELQASGEAANRFGQELHELMKNRVRWVEQIQNEIDEFETFINRAHVEIVQVREQGFNVDQEEEACRQAVGLALLARQRFDAKQHGQARDYIQTAGQMVRAAREAALNLPQLRQQLLGRIRELDAGFDYARQAILPAQAETLAHLQQLFHENSLRVVSRYVRDTAEIVQKGQHGMEVLKAAVAQGRVQWDRIGESIEKAAQLFSLVEERVAAVEAEKNRLEAQRKEVAKQIKLAEQRCEKLWDDALAHIYYNQDVVLQTIQEKEEVVDRYKVSLVRERPDIDTLSAQVSATRAELTRLRVRKTAA